MIRTAVTPVFLLLCLVLGGASAEGFAANCILQLAAIALIAWTLIFQRSTGLTVAARSLASLAVLLSIVLIAEMVPLPPSIWTALPGRQEVANGYHLLGSPLPWLPLTLAPQAAVSSALWLLPAMAVLAGMLGSGSFRAQWIAGAIIAAAIAGVLVGALQVLGGSNSPWYFYKFTNWGQAVGLFANANHMAALLVVAIPFTAALQADLLSRATAPQRVPTILVLTWAILLVIGVGIALNSSIAGLGLGLTTAVASAFLLRARPSWRVAIGGGVIALLLATSLSMIVIGPIQTKLLGPALDRQDIEQLTRRVSISQTIKLSAQYLPTGSGTGTFRQIYQQGEDPKDTFSTYMNHAHSDVAELLLEAGMIGVCLMLLLFIWWAGSALRIWRAEQPDFYARAATLASGALLAHSCVDYPLRTAGLSAVFAVCLALMSGVRPWTRGSTRRGNRHLNLG